jgi:hypothetical protein
MIKREGPCQQADIRQQMAQTMEAGTHGKVSPGWRRAMPPPPDVRVKVTEAFARMVAREAYFWAWPMVSIFNRRQAFSQVREPGLMNGVLPLAPLNRLAMLHDYVEPDQRWVACPNQDVVYGAGIAALDQSPVVVQVPDFGERFWVPRTPISRSSFAPIGRRRRSWTAHGPRPPSSACSDPRAAGGLRAAYPSQNFSSAASAVRWPSCQVSLSSRPCQAVLSVVCAFTYWRQRYSWKIAMMLSA